MRPFAQPAVTAPHPAAHAPQLPGQLPHPFSAMSPKELAVAVLCGKVSLSAINGMRTVNQAAPHTAATLAAASTVAASQTVDGWQVTNQPCFPGAPVGVRKQLSPGIWVNTVVHPGDARYPASI